MFKRKVILVALLAIVLLGALMDASADGKFLKRRRRASMERPCATCVAQSLSNFVNTIAGVRPTIDPSRGLALNWDHKRIKPHAEMVPADELASRGARKPIKRRVELEPAGLLQIAGGARTPDPTGTSRT